MRYYLCTFLLLYFSPYTIATETVVPTSYKTFIDSPFKQIDNFTYFHLDNFESGSHLSTPGITYDRGYVRRPAKWVDSVDSDDGNINNICSRCHSFFAPANINKPASVTISFNSEILGGLPTHAGLVWTDGKGETRFKAYDRYGNIIADSGTTNIADNSFFGTTVDDYFYGAIHPSGIAKIYIENTIDALEFDHLQFGSNIQPKYEAIAPIPYLDFTKNSPYSPLVETFEYFYLETFETGDSDFFGVTLSAGSNRAPANFIDSIDSDDGKIDGKCTSCRSWYVDQSSQRGLIISFDQETLGQLPTHAGLVWVDGLGETRFIAYDKNGNVLTDTGYLSIADNSLHNTVDEDHFFGLVAHEGIAKLYIENTKNDLEIDHLQYGFTKNLFPSSVTINAYQSFTQDSPLSELKDTFNYLHLETFESGAVSIPGVHFSNGTIRPSANFVDSVDIDDGVLDQQCINCKSLYFSQSTERGITIRFDEQTLGNLPTHAGIVWTDGMGDTRFIAYDKHGDIIADSQSIAIADDSFHGTVSDDYYFGTNYEHGISHIYIENAIDGIEVDHLQFGYIAPPTVQKVLPHQYKSYTKDSPFFQYESSALYSYLETFESGTIEIPGVSFDGGYIRGSAHFIDSVDEDDGIVDNKCRSCLSYFVDQTSQKSVNITFLATELGGVLPNYAGLVWTDGKGLTRFKGYDLEGNLVADSGFVSIADNSFHQTFDEDHFFGFEYPSGISKISIENTEDSLEIDHIQFGFK